MKRLGLTGGIGSGKSTVAAMFAELGAVIIDADAISRELMEPGQQVLKQTVGEFGSKILNDDGTLNRQALASIVFSDEIARQKLNAIVHPAVRLRSEELMTEAQKSQESSGIIIEDIPLLAETGQADKFDGVVVVEAQLEVRLARLEKYRGINREDALARIKSQVEDGERRKIATWLVDNSESQSETQRQVRKIWESIQQMPGK